MSEFLIVLIVNACIDLNYTKVQKQECLSHFGNCVENYPTEKKAIEECSKKWKKIKDEIK